MSTEWIVRSYLACVSELYEERRVGLCLFESTQACYEVQEAPLENRYELARLHETLENGLGFVGALYTSSH